MMFSQGKQGEILNSAKDQKDQQRTLIHFGTKECLLEGRAKKENSIPERGTPSCRLYFAELSKDNWNEEAETPIE